MKNQLIKVAAAVPALRIGDIDFNTEQILSVLRTETDSGLIVFPELTVTGYTCADLFRSELILRKTENALLQIAEATSGRGVTAVVGAPLRLDNSLYNCAVIISDGVIRAVVPKSFLPNYSEFYECRWFASGKGIRGRSVRIGTEEAAFGTDILCADENSGAVLGTELCEDLWVPDKPSTHAALAGANLIANLSASDEIIGKQEYRSQLVRQQSGALYCGYVYVSSGTGESSTDLVFSGHTMIAQSGSMLRESIFPTEPWVETTLVDIGCLNHDRMRQNTFGTVGAEKYRRIPVSIPAVGAAEVTAGELAAILREQNYPVARNPFVPADDILRDTRCRRILQIQSSGLATRVRATGIKNLVIGVSGGLDSTLALLVCAEAKKQIPDIRIIAYTMPNQGNTSGLTFDNATKLMRLLADESYTVPIREGVEQHLTALGHETRYQGEGDVTYENAQARMRTYILMDAANMRNGLVIGTGDLSELALGWCTYNGDHMSMYAVNASVPKTLVRYICRSYAAICDNPELRDTLLSVCDTPITPELTPSEDGAFAQKTEEKIGSYDINDFFLYYTLRFGFAPEKTMAFAMQAYSELSPDDAENASRNFFRRFFSQQFKRSCMPDGPKVGSVSLSPRGDWRMPSDASSAMWLENSKSVR